MIARIRAAGSTDVIQMGESYAEANQYLLDEVLPKDPNGVYVSAYDHPDIWTGCASLVHEIKTQMGENGPPDAVVLCVGGGGLFCGVMQGLEECYGKGKMPRVVAVETIGAAGLHKSLQKGELVTLDAITTQAMSLGAKRVAEQAFKYGQRENVKSLVIEDAEAAMGVWRLADDEKLLVEMACGASVAFAYDGRLKRVVEDLGPKSKVVIIVCGGAGISVEMIMKWREQFASAEKLATNDQDVSSTHTAPEG